MLTATLDVRSAAYPDTPKIFSIEVENGTSLLSVLETLANREEYIRTYVFSLKEKRMRPYHLITLDSKIIFPQELQEYTFSEDVCLKVIPFVSGG